MKWFYFQQDKGYQDLNFILSELDYTDFDECEIWLRKMSGDTNRLRMDAVKSKLITAMYR